MKTKFPIHSFRRESVRLLEDMQTPVGLYRKIRKEFSESVLLESTDFDLHQENHSYIGFSPLVSFEVKDGMIRLCGAPLGKVSKTASVSAGFLLFLESIKMNPEEDPNLMTGVFGFCRYEAARYYHAAPLLKRDLGSFPEYTEIPEVYYALYRFVLQMDHRTNEFILTEYIPEGSSGKLRDVLRMLQAPAPLEDSCTFRASPGEADPRGGSDPLLWKEKSKELSRIALSRGRIQRYQGDDFQVYRALRSVAPSPYLFYYQFENFRIFGSSQEPLITVRNQKAMASFVETQVPEMQGVQPSVSEKRKAHEMMVNESLRLFGLYTRNVKLEAYREERMQSCPRCLESAISGEITQAEEGEALFSDLFPSISLTGIPEVRAIEVLEETENSLRGFFGGCIGYAGLQGDRVHAVIRRAFFSRDQVLYNRYLSAIVQEGKIISEDARDTEEEVLRKAVELAENLKVNPI